MLRWTSLRFNTSCHPALKILNLPAQLQTGYVTHMSGFLTVFVCQAPGKEIIVTLKERPKPASVYFFF